FHPHVVPIGLYSADMHRSLAEASEMKRSGQRVSQGGKARHHPQRAAGGGDPPPDKATVVLAAARSVFLSHGFSAATTDMIQQAAGVSKATVYSHYPTKEALFIAVIDAECERFIASIRALRLQSMRPEDALLALAQAYMEIVLSPSALSLF